MTKWKKLILHGIFHRIQEVRIILFQKWGRKRNSDLENKKKGLYLELPRKEHSSTYSKGEFKLLQEQYT